MTHPHHPAKQRTQREGQDHSEQDLGMPTPTPEGVTVTTDTSRNASALRDDRKTVTQLLDAAEKDTDAVSVFMAGCMVADTEAAVFVVKGPEHIAYLRAMCERQGMLTADKPVAGPICNLRKPWEKP